MTNTNQPTTISWIAESSASENCACFGLLLEGSAHDVIDELRSGVFVDETMCYLCATDGDAMIDTHATNCSFSLVVHEKVLFTSAVDSLWAALAQSQEGVWWIRIYCDLDLERVRKYTVSELLESLQHGHLEIIAVAVRNHP